MRYCPSERDVSAAVHSGDLNAELLAHVQSCQICDDILSVANALKNEAAAFQGAQLPHADLIWARAQQRTREQAITKATLPIRIAALCTMVVAAVSIPWLVLYLIQSPWSVPVLRSFSLLRSDWLTALSGTTTISLGGSFLAIALGSWYILRED
jgi:hypothetical protein